MKRCSRCRVEKAPEEFGGCRSRRDGLQTYCRECRRERDRMEAARQWAKNHGMVVPRPAGGDPPRVIHEMDRYPDRCMWHMGTLHPCLEKATWRNGEWRACDRHRLPGDRPSVPTPRAPTGP